MEVTDTKYMAAEILSQLGGRQFLVMTGSKNLVWDSKTDTLTMKLIPNKTKAKWMKIHLNGLDLYDVTFITANKATGDIKIVKEIPNLYSDMLRSTFEQETGLYTKLF